MRQRAFFLLWSAGLLSSLASWSFGIAAAVHIFQVTGSAAATAGLVVATTAPTVAIAGLGGVVADRVNRVRLLQAVSTVRAVVVAVPIVAGDHPWVLWAVVAAQSTALQFFTPAEQATVADVVPAEHLADATGANSAALNVTRLVGPAVGGVLVASLGFPLTAGVITGALVAATGLLGGLGAADVPSTLGSRHSPGIAVRDWSRSWRDGWMSAFRGRDRRVVVAFQLSDAVKEGALSSLFPVLMLGVIGAGPPVTGLVNSSFALTALVAAPTVGAITRRLGYPVPVVTGATVAAALLLVLAIWPSRATALAVFALSGFPFTVSWVAAAALLLIRTTPDTRGRVVATTNTLYSAVTLFSALAAGAAVPAISVQAVLTIAATTQIGVLAALALLWARPSAAASTRR